ncbi:MAG: YHS domain-containing protein [Actinomycetota bacterium]
MMWGIIRDPVCNARVKKTTPYCYKFNGKIFYFDCAACRQTFIDEPEKFAGSKKEKKPVEEVSIPSECNGECSLCHKKDIKTL